MTGLRFQRAGITFLVAAHATDKVVVDDWGQCRKGLPYGALRAHVDLDKATERNLHAELGQIVAGRKPGRESDGETILCWHRGLSLSDIALGHAMLRKADAMVSAKLCVSPYSPTPTGGWRRCLTSVLQGME